MKQKFENTEIIKHHKEFESWKNDDEKLNKLLEGSKVFVRPWDKEVAWREWEAGRRYIADAITEDGTILDYGCANGFLLRSLQEWTDNEFDPYGYDIDQEGIAEARALFPKIPDHFAHPSEKVPENFPTNPGGKLMLGMYDDMEMNERKIEKLRERGFIPNAVIQNQHGKGALVIFDKEAEYIK